MPVCVSDGKTKKEALNNVKEAIEGYVETLEEMKWSLPKIVSVNRVAVEINAKAA